MAKKDNVNGGVKTTIWIIGVIVVLVLVFFFSYSVFKNTGRIEYQGLVFSKENFGSASAFITFYRYTYQFPDGQGNIINYDFRVRTNPAENNVPITTDGPIMFPQSRKVYLSIDESLGQCNQSSITIAGLSQFIGANQFSLVSGVSNKTMAQEENVSYVDCDSDSEGIIISLRAGNETRVYQSGNCFIVEENQCQILPATEKFEVQALADAINRAKSKQ